MVWLLERSKYGMILILERCRTMCGQSQIYDLINSDRCSRDVKMLWFFDSKGAEMIWFCQSIQIWCLLSGTGVLILQFPARSTCQIRTLERRMATKPNWTKISALSYYMRESQIYVLYHLERRMTSLESKTKLNQMSYVFYRGPVC